MRRLAIALGAALIFICSPAQAATLHVAPGGSGSACSALAPCGDLNTAYGTAQPGDTVELAAGTYGTQSIQATSKPAGPRVVFQPALGAQVTLGAVNVYRPHVELRDMTVQDLTIREQDVATPAAVSDVATHNLNGRNFNVFDATDVTLHGGEWGPASSCGGPDGGGNNSIRRIAGVNPQRITIEDTSIHDVQSYNLTNCHTEGLAIFAGQDITVQRTKFTGDSVYDVFVQNNSGPISGLTFENDWFATPVGTGGAANGTTIGFSTVPQNVTIANNSFNGQASLDDNGTNSIYTGWTIAGNVGPLQFNACTYRGIQWSYNVVTNRAACGATDKQVSGVPFVNASNVTASADYHLTGGPAVDMIPASALLVSTDMDGIARPQGAAGDAGANEATSAAPSPTPTATPSPTPTATPSPTPTATPSPTPTATPYSPACEPTCDEQVAKLQDQLARIRAITGE